MAWIWSSDTGHVSLTLMFLFIITPTHTHTPPCTSNPSISHPLELLPPISCPKSHVFFVFFFAFFFAEGQRFYLLCLRSLKLLRSQPQTRVHPRQSALACEINEEGLHAEAPFSSCLFSAALICRSEMQRDLPG